MLSAPRQQLRSLVRVPSHRSLVSSVLFTRSAADWQSEPASTLKEELQKRGLSITGNKKALVNRLVKSEQTRELGSFTPGPTPAASPAPSAPPSPNPNTHSTPTPKPAAPSLTQQLLTRPVSTSAVIRATAPPRDKFTPRSHQLVIELPEAREEEELGPIIPTLPYNFTTTAADSASPHQTPSTASDEPKVLTVASASTHLGGGPTHSMFEAKDAHAEEVSSSANEQMTSSTAEASATAAGVLESVKDAVGWEKVFGKAPSTAELQARAKEGADAAVAAFTASLSNVQQRVGIPEVEQGGFSREEAMRDLHTEEKTGIWILLGLVSGGWLLGGLFAPPTGSSHNDH